MKITKQYLKQVIKEELEKITENPQSAAQQISGAFQNFYDPMYASLQRAAFLAMQGRVSEAKSYLNTALKGVDDKIKQQIVDSLTNIKPVTINGKIATTSDLDKSKPHKEWVQKTFIPWAMNLMGKK